jgi:HK97 family phage prohead protease
MNCQTMKAIVKQSDKGIYEIWASTNQLDSTNERVMPTAFKNLSEYLSVYPRIMYGHSWVKMFVAGEETFPIGRAISGEIVADKGLKLRFEFTSLPFAQKVKTLIDSGFPMFASIGGFTQAADEQPDGTRNITDFKLIEVSIVPIPANDGAVFIRQLKTAGANTQLVEDAIKSLTPIVQEPTGGNARKVGLKERMLMFANSANRKDN